MNNHHNRDRSGVVDINSELLAPHDIGMHDLCEVSYCDLVVAEVQSYMIFLRQSKKDATKQLRT